MSKQKAKKFVNRLGYTELFAEGRSGDLPQGSRQYWIKPGEEMNEFGWPKYYAMMSRLPKGGFATLGEYLWVVKIFDERAPSSDQLKIGDWVQTANGRVGRISEGGPAIATVQFGADGPFENHYRSTLKPATKMQIAVMEGRS